MEGFRFFEVFSADVRWHQSCFTTCLLAAAKNIAHGRAKRGRKILQGEKYIQKYLAVWRRCGKTIHINNKIHSSYSVVRR